MKVRIKKLHKDAKIPTRAHITDAALDLTCTDITIDWAKQEVVCHTGLAFEIPVGHAGLVYPRSSICNKPLVLHNSVGVIDSGYRGEVTVKFLITNPRDFLQSQGAGYIIGDKVAQIMIVPYPEIEFEEAEELSDSDRGIGGYGSTGR